MTLEETLAEARITEMEIMRYADGVLAPERRPIVRAALATYPELMQLLESFLFTRGPLVDAFDVVLDAPVPARILNVLQPRQQPAGFFDWLNPATWPQLRFRTPVFAVAGLAAVALLAWLMNYAVRYDFIPPDRQGVAAPSTLQQALDATPVGASVQLVEHLAFEPQLTFYSRLKLWCREYGLTYGNNALWEGRLACRGTDGVWRVLSETNPLPSKPDGRLPDWQPAGEDALGGLATARADLKVGDVLGVEAEADLIKNRWQGRP